MTSSALGRVGLWISLLCLLTACVDFGGSGEDDKSDKGTDSSDEKKRSTLVRAVAPTRGKLSDRLEITARVEAYERAGILPRVEGVIQRVHRYEGDRVKAGDVLAEIESDEQAIDRDGATLAVRQAELAVTQAQLALEESKAQLRGEKITLDNETRKLNRAREQHAKTIISDQDLEAAEYAFDTAQATYGQTEIAFRKLEEDLKVKKLMQKDAESKLDQAKLRLAYTKIKATLDGTITTRNVKLGQRTMMGEAAFEIDDLESLVIMASVPEKELRILSEGLPVVLGCTSYPDKKFSGKVEFISRKIDPNGGKVKTRIRLDRSDPPLLPGMFVSGHIVTEERKGILLLPKKALLFDRDRPYVFVVDRSESPPVARQIYVQRGLENTEMVEYLPALGKDAEITEDSEIVMIGVDRLFDGAPLRIDGEEPPADDADEDGADDKNAKQE